MCYNNTCHVHFKHELDFSKFKNRIFAVHLHDFYKKGYEVGKKLEVMFE